jgi:alanyl-tRNA synthetase
MLQGKKTVYEIETFVPIIAAIEERSGIRLGAAAPRGEPAVRDAATGRSAAAAPGGASLAEHDRSIRIITDHVRAAVFILGDPKGITPSNLGQGYILRRLIRRAIRHARKLGMHEDALSAPAAACVAIFQDAYPELGRNRDKILTELRREEEKFLGTLQKGEQEFEKLLPNLLKNPRTVVPGRVAFRLYDTYGFPLELTQELAGEHGLGVDVQGFEEAYRKHQELSKSGAEKTFKGGLADQTEMTRKLHTATHLLHQALRTVLGDHVQQKGSNITSERLRFDFSHPEGMTPEQIRRVEDIVNEQIRRDLQVSFQTMTLEQARETGAIALFGDRYDEKVKVYSIGDFSKEVCGGPHVERTGVLGRFRITKEQSSSAGVRRVKAVLESS